jgi:HEPN domain-containing protein
MKPRPQAEARRWLAQARSEIAFARVGLREGFYAQSCFHCQQSAEMALKALHYLGGARMVIGHSLVGLIAPLAETYPGLAPLRGTAARLDQLYIPTRCPNVLPTEVFSLEQAYAANDEAARVIDLCAALIQSS